MEDDSRTKDRDNGKMRFFLEVIKTSISVVVNESLNSWREMCKKGGHS